MRTCFHFSTCVCVVLLLGCHRFSSSEAAVGDAQTHISRLGESPIGPHHRQRRSEVSTNEIGDGEDDQQENSGQSDQEDNNDGDDDDNDDDEEEEEEEEDDDGQDESVGDSRSLSSTSRVKENLNLLKNTRKSLGRYVREGEDSPLNKLMSESSELAKEVSTVFHQLAKREVDLAKEMESLKEALNGAVVTLKNTIKSEEENKELSDNKVEGESSEKVGDEGEKQTLPRQRRHFNYPNNPYRACVSIEPANDEGYESQSANDRYKNGAAGAAQSGSVSIQEYMPPKDGSKNIPLPPSPSSMSSTSNIAVQNGYADNTRQSQSISANYPSPNKAYIASGSSAFQSSSNHISSESAGSVRNDQPRPLPPRPLLMIPQPLRNPPQAPQYQSKAATYNSNLNDATNTNQQYASSSSSSHHEQFSNNQNNNNMNEVDLSEVYWVRLDPKRKQEMLHNKLDSLLKQKQHQGKDVLVIPLSHGLHDTQEVKNGFLRAVRVRPQALNNKLFRKLRSLHVMEL